MSILSIVIFRFISILWDSAEKEKKLLVAIRNTSKITYAFGSSIRDISTND
jgi:hypothetical protein